MHGDNKQAHPSYGVIEISRCTSSKPAPFFGTELGHSNWVIVKIRQASEEHHLSEEWIYGGEPLIQVRMTELQFAQMLTTANMSPGVPCTIERIGREEVDLVPPTLHAKRNREQASVDAKKAITALRDAVTQCVSMQKQDRIKKGDVGKLKALVEKSLQVAESSLPFVVSQMEERMEKVVAEAKKSIDVYLQTQSLAALRQLSSGSQGPVELIEGNEEEAHDA